MKTILCVLAAALMALPTCWADAVDADAAKKQPPTTGASASDSEARATRRYDEMLGKMQAAVEEIAQLYGNPVFLQVFTNDEERASQLKERLRSAQTGDEVRSQVTDLQKKREELLNDIALKERESARLTSRLVRQRAALDALAEAVEQARKAVEDTAK